MMDIICYYLNPTPNQIIDYPPSADYTYKNTSLLLRHRFKFHQHIIFENGAACIFLYHAKHRYIGGVSALTRRSVSFYFQLGLHT